MTKKQRQIFSSYLCSEKTTLGECYASYSKAKYEAYMDCIKLKVELHGFDFRIISSNGWIFTCGFQYPDPETGEIKFCYITPSRTEFFEIDWSLFK